MVYGGTFTYPVVATTGADFMKMGQELDAFLTQTGYCNCDFEYFTFESQKQYFWLGV